MAKRRMLSIPIVETDKFYSLTTAAQALYIHMNLNADDDGVVDRVKLITNQMRIRKSCYSELVLGGYIIELDDGLAAITHWHQHNQIRKERYVKGEYLDKISSLSLQENGRFIKGSSAFLGDKSTPQDSIDKDRKDKISTDEISKDEIREEECKKREGEEKENSFNQTCIHTSVATLPEEQTADNLSIPDKNTIIALRTLIQLYFMQLQRVEYTDEFISYCSSINWQMDRMPMTIYNYRSFIDEWLTKNKGAPCGTPLESN